MKKVKMSMKLYLIADCEIMVSLKNLENMEIQMTD